MLQPTPIILASASPRRRQLLAEMGVAFTVLPANVDEWEHPEADPKEMVLHNAEKKADFLARQSLHAPVLGADTTVALEGVVLNKPADMTEARAMLMQLSGKTHTVYTGVALNWSGKGIRDSFCETSFVKFRELTDAVIDSYFQIVNPLDKAGAYGIQEGRDLIIEKWDGSLHNIMGLPTERLALFLRKHGLMA